MLNQLGFYVFLPALAFSKLAQSISWHDLATWWPLPLNVFIKCVRKTAWPLMLSGEPHSEHAARTYSVTSCC